MAINFSLLRDLHRVCSQGVKDCTIEHWPTISETIASNEAYNKVFLLLVTVFMWGIVTDIVRSFHKMLHGKVSTSTNLIYLALGYVMVLFLPLIGIFDCINYKSIHGTCAFIFFGTTSIYMTLVGNALYRNLDSFSADKQKAILLAKKAIVGLFITLFGMLGFLIAHDVKGVPRGYSNMFEWATVIYYVTFFAIIIQTNTFVDTVHDKSQTL